MVVQITNLTDAPGKRPRELRIFNTTLRPGKSLRIQAQYVDAKMRAMEEAGHISIGAVPAWYTDHKATRVLTHDQVVASRKHAADVVKRKAEANAKILGKGKKPVPAPEPAPPHKGELAMVDEAKVEDDLEPKSENKSGKRKRR